VSPPAAAEPYAVTPVDGPLDAVVAVPGSKSITNRALLAAALAEGASRLDGALFAEDTEAMLDCLARLGAGIAAEPEAAAVTVDGLAGELPDGEVDLDARQAGTTARFLLPVLAAGPGSYRLDGDAQLRARPMAHGIAAARSLGAVVDEEGEPGHLPIVVRGGREASITGPVRIAGDVSSQFLSGLLLAGPLRPDGLEVEVVGALKSRPYVEMTAAVMAAFGVDVASPSPSRFVVPPSTYEGGRHHIEPDASAASYFLAAAAICGGRVEVPGLAADSVQGDAGFADLLARMGVAARWTEHGVEVVGGDTLEGVDADLSHMSDLAPTLAVVAAFARTPTRVRGVGFIRRKESDRVAIVVRELRRCGVDAEEDDDGFVVRPDRNRSVHGAAIDPEGDHRIAMAFALVGLRVPGIAVADPGCVAKTFPGYWSTLASLASHPSLPNMRR
jgi:3-phosphoshikimate 1-carboxyvinyltransferase